MEPHPRIIAIVGEPWSGKTTVAEALVTRPPLVGHAVHIDMQAEAARLHLPDVSPSMLPRPSSLLIDPTIGGATLLQALFRHTETPVPFLILDGAPRTSAQVGHLLSLCALLDCELAGAIHTKISSAEALHRMIKRGRPGSMQKAALSEGAALQEIALYEEYSFDVPDALRASGTPVHELQMDRPRDITLRRALGLAALLRDNRL